MELQLAQEKEAGLEPIPLHRSGGQAQQLRDFPLRQSAEEAELDHVAKAGVNPAQLLEGVVFPGQVIDEVTAFMLALTDPAARNLGHVVPATVPSGLPVDGN